MYDFLFKKFNIDLNNFDSIIILFPLSILLSFIFFPIKLFVVLYKNIFKKEV